MPRLQRSRRCCSEATGPSRRVRSPLCVPQRHAERKRRAHPDLALHPDLSAVELDEFAAEREPKPCAFDLPCRTPYLAEFLEHLLLIFRRDADPGVAH